MSLGCCTVEDTTLTGLGLDQSLPLFHEEFYVWLLSVGYRVVSQGTLAFVVPPVARLGITHTVVRQVRQADHGRTSDTAYDYDLTNLTHQIVTLKRGQLAALCLLEDSYSKAEQVHQRCRTTRSTTEGLQACASRTHLRDIPLRDFTSPQERQNLTQGLSPTLFAVLDHYGRLTVEEGIWNLWQLGDVLTLHREAYTRATEQDEHSLIKALRVVYREIATVVAGGVISVQCWTSSHHSTHRGHNLKIEDGSSKSGSCVSAYAKTYNFVHVALYGFSPVLSTAFGLKPACVARLGNKLLVGGGQ